MSFKFRFVKTDLPALAGVVKDFKKEFIESFADKAEDIIVNQNIKKGNSPVNGAGKFEPYSDSYIAAIKSGRYKKDGKKTKPVNLTLTGKMLKSFKVQKTGGGLSMTFTDKKADYHNLLGAGPSHTLRPMLPIGSEGFTPKITKQILDLITQAIDKIVAKFK